MILGHISFFEIQDLLAVRGSMVKNLDELPPEIHFHSLLEFWKRFAVEVIILQEGYFARSFVNLEDVHISQVSVQHFCASDIDP